jgi:hypothetical protein
MNSKSIKLTPRVPDLKWEDVQSIPDWINTVEAGGFIDYDGFGMLATDTQDSNLYVKPSYVLGGKIQYVGIDMFLKVVKIDEETLKQFTQVIWYNR